MNMINRKVDFFRFEEEFVEANIRCIPMIVRFKLDACGIKLRLAEWSRMIPSERKHLAQSPCLTLPQIAQYRKDLTRIILDRTGNQATELPIPATTAWKKLDKIPDSIKEKLQEFSCSMTLPQWQSLSDLQRFALLKLSYPGHENKNFPKALAEFGLS